MTVRVPQADAVAAHSRIKLLEDVLVEAGWTQVDDRWQAPDAYRRAIELSYGTGNWSLPQAIMFLARDAVGVAELDARENAQHHPEPTQA